MIFCENHGADWLPLQALRAVKTTRAGGPCPPSEVVWLSSFNAMPTFQTGAGVDIAA